MPTLEDQVVLVTGGSRSLGRIIALKLAREGADLILAAPEADELSATVADIEALGRKALPIVTDVSREADVSEMAARALDEFGRIDVLINNAGIIGPTANVQDVARSDWDQVLAVNLTGAFLCAKAVLPQMIARRRGKIINIASIAGKMGYALRSPYSVSKWGLIGLTLSLAKETGEHNIQVNAICPGPIDGERMRMLIKTRAREQGRRVEDVTNEYVKTTLLGRFVQPEDVAAMVAYLASPAGDNITGQAIDVSAGYGV